MMALFFFFNFSVHFVIIDVVFSVIMILVNRSLGGLAET